MYSWGGVISLYSGKNKKGGIFPSDRHIFPCSRTEAVEGHHSFLWLSDCSSRGEGSKIHFNPHRHINIPLDDFRAKSGVVSLKRLQKGKKKSRSSGNYLRPLPVFGRSLAF